MNPPNEQNPRQRFQQKENLETEQQTRTRAAAEFGSVEEMLRHDALHTPVPPKVKDRLAESISKEAPPKPTTWWKRMFGGS